ncbi:MAG: hypothetical protein LUG21_00655 [Clostridiales bacterium]|nr:hypothetical protein [Clostridiales bacterium]
MELKYKFSYGSILNYIATQCIIICYHLFILLYSTGLIFLAFGCLGDGFLSIILKSLAVIQFVALCLYFIITLFIPKKVILTNHFIKIRRYFLDVSYAFRGFNDEIFIKDVMECNKYNGKRFLLKRTEPYAVFFFNWDDLVEIKTIDEKNI